MHTCLWNLIKLIQDETLFYLPVIYMLWDVTLLPLAIIWNHSLPRKHRVGGFVTLKLCMWFEMVTFQVIIINIQMNQNHIKLKLNLPYIDSIFMKISPFSTEAKRMPDKLGFIQHTTFYLICFSLMVCPRNRNVQWAVHMFNSSKLKKIFWHFLERRCNRSYKIFSMTISESFLGILLMWYIRKSRPSRVLPFNAKVRQEHYCLLCDNDVIVSKVYDAKILVSLRQVLLVFVSVAKFSYNNIFTT